MYEKKTAQNTPNEAYSMKKSISSPAERNLPNSSMLNRVNRNEAMEREADRVSAEVGAAFSNLNDIKSALGSRLGVDFSNVKIHTDDAADRAAKSYNARAFTKGGDVFLGKDGMNPVIAAHELVHTVQQGAVSGGNVMSAPSDQVQLWGKKKPAPNNQLLDIGSMKFNKRAYKSDEEYQGLMQMMNNFNKSNGSDEDRIALMEAAMNYIDKNSRGEKQKHAGRTANAENLLYKLSMDNGQQNKAMDNISRMQNQINFAEDEYGKTNKAEGHNVLNDIGNAVQGNGGFSKAMTMIAANVMADQKKTDYALNGQSGSSRIYGNDNDPDNFRYKVTGRAEAKDHKDNIGTNFHEFTHASVGETYDNTRMFFALNKNASDDEILKQKNDRMQRMNELQDSFNQLSQNNASFKNNQPYNMTDRFDYATNDKTIDNYANSFLGDRIKQNINGKNVMYRKGGAFEKAMSKSNGSTKSKIAKEKMQATKMLSPFAKEKDEKNVTYFAAKKRADELYELKKKNPGNNEYLKMYKEAQAEANALSEKTTANSNTAIEYEPVINQMLIQYEMNGNDRSSQHYRQLKAAALRAHVDRSKERIMKNKSQK